MSTDRHFLVRLYEDRVTTDEVPSREDQIAALEAEKGGKNILVLGGLSSNGDVFAQYWPNHRPGAPLAGVLIVLGLAVASEQPPQASDIVTFAANADPLLDQLNALPLDGGEAFLILSNGATFHRSLRADSTLTLNLGNSEADKHDDIGELLAGHPDVPPVYAAAKLLDGLVDPSKNSAIVLSGAAGTITPTEIDSAATTAPVTGTESALSTSDASVSEATQDASASASEDAPTGSPTTRKGRASQATASAGED